MKEGSPHPKSGAYREHKEAVISHAERVREDDAAEWMFPKDALEYELRPEERADVLNFAEYASLRLTAGAVSSPLSREHLRAGKVDYAIKELATNSHDLWHAAIRYRRTEGRSLVPAYMDARTELEQAMSREALSEELAVDLFEASGPRYAASLIQSLETGQSSQEYAQHLAEFNPDVRRRYESIESLRHDDPALYFAKAHSIAYLEDLANVMRMRAKGRDETREVEEHYRQITEDMIAHPDEEYLRLARARYESTLGDAPDPRFEINEFRSMLSPLLERLKLKKMAAELDKLAT